MKFTGLLTVAMLLFAVGCGGTSTDQVNGTVTLDGAPLPNAELEFTLIEGGRPGYATTDESGKYVVEYLPEQPGLPAGDYKVSISTETTIENEDGSETAVPEKVPAKYNVQTELKKTVVAGQENVFDFDLTSN